MRCEQFEQRMQWLLDRRRPPEWDSSLQAHALHCDDCSALLESQSLLFDGLEHSALPQLPDTFASRAVRQGRRRPDSRWRAALLIGIAAAMLVAVIPLASNMSRVDPAPIAQLTAPRLPLDATQTDFSNSTANTPQASAPAQLFAFEIAQANRFAMGLRPLTFTFSAALDAIRRTFVDPFTEYNPGDIDVDWPAIL